VRYAGIELCWVWLEVFLNTQLDLLPLFFEKVFLEIKLFVLILDLTDLFTDLPALSFLANDAQLQVLDFFV
jgi:hypothetical protein